MKEKRERKSNIRSARKQQVSVAAAPGLPNTHVSLLRVGVGEQVIYCYQSLTRPEAVRVEEESARDQDDRRGGAQRGGQAQEDQQAGHLGEKVRKFVSFVCDKMVIMMREIIIISKQRLDFAMEEAGIGASSPSPSSYEHQQYEMLPPYHHHHHHMPYLQQQQQQYQDYRYNK